MLKFLRRSVVATLLATCALGNTAQAVSSTAQVWDDRYYVEGQIVCCKSADGDMVPLLRYDGSVYLPLRTAGEWMGKEVGWDAANRTISLSGTVTPHYETDFDHGYIWTDDALQVSVQPDISVVVDSEKQTLKSADGNTIYPLIYEGTSYLPLRAIGELMDKEVTWIRLRANHEEIYIRTPLTAAQKQEAENYLKQASTLCKDIEAKGTAFVGLDDTTSASTAQKDLDDLMTSIQKLQTMSRPSAPVVQRSCEMLQENLNDMSEIAQDVDEILEKSKTVTEAKDYLFARDSEDSIPKKNILQGAYLTGSLVRMHAVLSQDGSSFTP